MMYQSRRYNPLAFDRFWRPFVRIFQAFAVSHYSIFHKNIHIGHMIYFFTISLIHTRVMLHTLRHIQSVDNINYGGSPIMYYVSLISIIGNFVAHMVSNLEPLVSRKDEEEIYQKLREIDEILATKLNCFTDFNALRRKYIKHTVLYFVLTGLLSFGLSYFSMPKNGIFPYLLNRLVSATVIRVRRCQIAFHINALTNILTNLQHLLKRQQENFRPLSSETDLSVRKNIQHIRDVYSNAWIIKNLMSSCFGWSLISMILEFSVVLINLIYWGYINATKYKSFRKIFRKVLVSFQCIHYFNNFNISEIVSSIFAIIVNFHYFCKISERCQSAVGHKNTENISLYKHFCFQIEYFTGKRSFEITTHFL